jgi:O-antigen/teichoic acid export membrane protein
MSLKRNILANYLSQVYVTLIGIVMLPVYIRYMGAESYGLVGFYAMLQAWFMMLDMGLSPTITRESARYQGGSSTAIDYLRLVRALEGVFLFVALAGGVALFTAANDIADGWLQATQLPISEVRTSVQLMAAIIALRWLCGLYRGIISGSERLVWLSGFNSLIASIRFVGVLLVLIYVGVTPTDFFSFQLGVAVLELIGLQIYAYRLMPAILEGQLLWWDWKPLKPVFKFSMTIAFTSSVMVLVTQTDKLVLSKILPLAEYGYFTLAVVVAGGVTLINGPISAAIMPRMSKLEAEGDHAGLIRVYRSSTQLVAIFAAAASVTVLFFAESLLWSWTGDRELACQAAPILILYGIGNGILAVAAFPYYLQYAKGDLRLHLIGSAIFVVLLIPAIIWTASEYGAIGAGYVWLSLNLISFVFWLPFIHHRFEPGLNRKWYLEDICTIYLAIFAGGYALNLFIPHIDSRVGIAMLTIGFGLMMLLLGVVASSMARAEFKAFKVGHSNI